MTKLWITLLIGCLNFQFVQAQLNKQINESQQIAIDKSPFESAKGMKERILFQKKLRPKFLKILESLRNEFPRDTLMLIENYSALCDNCPADFIQIKKGTDLISLKLEYEKPLEYIIEKKILKDIIFDENGYRRKDIIELKRDIGKNDLWVENAQKYGTESCFDGGHTFYTIIYPKNKVLSLYIRCWINEEDRT